MMSRVFYLIFTMLILLFTACEDIPSGQRQISSQEVVNSDNSGGSTGSNGLPGDGAIGGGDGGLNNDPEMIQAKVEIRHLIEPEVDTNSNSGKYTRKLTLPKNYNGLLYLAGINISTLASKNVHVRFKLGRNRAPITIPATVSTGSGITPQTNIEVLVMDLRNRPFNNVQLPFDLFDYNDYEFDSNVTPAPGQLEEPVDYNRDENLYCRGLRLEDDPTFTGSLASSCSSQNDVCKYAYAKVVDKGLVNTVTGNAILPTELNIAALSNDYDEDPDSIKLKRCLPDNYDHGAYVYDASVNPIISFPLFGSQRSIQGINYAYQGPYQSNDFLNWEIKDEAILSPSFGVFRGHNDIDGNSLSMSLFESNNGYLSKLFPLYTRFNLTTGVEYMGSSQPDGVKALQTMLSNSDSLYMDGCNERVSTVHQFTGEHVGSCNVSARLEIITIDDNGTENIIDSTSEVKLQLVKPEEIRSSGENLLLSSFQSCQSSSQCGSGACCINKRCWSKTIVSQCVEDMDSFGDLQPGDTCNSDHECASLCCNRSSGKCAVHNTLLSPPVLCSKPSGQTCISQEFCQKHPITRCFIVKTGFDALGGETCALRCYNYEEHGKCIASSGTNAGVCVPPPTPSQPVFNPSDPDRCADAISPNDVPLNNRVD